jgi:hypothetical protein
MPISHHNNIPGSTAFGQQPLCPIPEGTARLDFDAARNVDVAGVGDANNPFEGAALPHHPGTSMSSNGTSSNAVSSSNERGTGTESKERRRIGSGGLGGLVLRN